MPRLLHNGGNRSPETARPKPERRVPEEVRAPALDAAHPHVHGGGARRRARRRGVPLGDLGSAGPAPGVRGLGSAKLANFAKFCKFLAGSFSAVSKRNFARKYAFDSIFQALQDLHTFAPLQSQNIFSLSKV